MATETTVVSLHELHWPLPPPSPPDLPPLPPPERGLNATTDQLECQFEQGIDLSVSSSSDQQKSTTGGSGHSAHAVDSQTQCCALCAMKNGCTRFVFMPGSGVCALLPQVHKSELLRISNPATVAGTVFVAHGDKEGKTSHKHTNCMFEVGYGYSQGALGAGRPLDEPQITSQQACCDACERNPDCAKFVFEKFGGSCQLYESFAERYHTPGLIAGSIPARLAVGYQAVANMLAASNGNSGDKYGGGDGDDMRRIAPHPPFVLPPYPPSFAHAIASPPPSPPNGEGGAAQTVLALGSIAVSVLLGFTLLFFIYCFYFGEIQGLLHRWTRGRMGKPQFSLLPKALQDLELEPDAELSETSKRHRGKREAKMIKGPNKGLPSPGHVSVTCVTEHVTQKKVIKMDQCADMAEARALLWEAFGHVLKGTSDSKVIILCSVPTTDMGESEGCKWMMLTAASDLQQAMACPTWKMAEKAIAAPQGETFPLAFAGAKDEAKAARKNQQQQQQNDKKKRDEAKERIIAELVAGIDVGHTGEPQEPQEPQEQNEQQEQQEQQEQRASMGSVVRPLWRQRQQYNIHLDNEGSTVGSDGDDDGFSAINVGSARTASTRQRTTQGSAGWSDDLPNDLQAQTATEGQDPTDLVGLRMMAAERDRRAAQRTAAAAEADREHLRDLYKYHGFNSKSNPDEGDALDPELGSLLLLMVGKRVEVHGLKTTAHLNGRVGTVTKLDEAKGRFRVRLEPVADGEPPQTMAFRPDNLKML